jgi:ABC-type transport system involved in cytochrome bd biosynthesis fused ATPase/permease subunit
VVPRAPEDPSRAARIGAARALGAAQSLAVLAFAALSAEGINRLARREVSAGLVALATALAGRWLVGVGVDAWGDATAQRVREAWRGRLLSHFERPRREGERSRGDLALAIEHAAATPSLEALRSAAGASLAGIAVVFVAAGALSAGLVVALLAVAAPLYQRAGRRSETLEEDYERRRAQLEARQLEVLRRSPELRALGAVEYGAGAIAALSDSEHGLALRAIRVALGSSLVTEFLSGVSVGLVAMVVGFALLGGRVSLLRALVAVLVTTELFTQVRRYGSQFHRRERASRSHEFLTSAVPGPLAEVGPWLLRAEALVSDAGGTPLSLRVAPGDRIVITGASGVGKTTLLHTLVGWRAPREGRVERTPGPVGFVSAETSLLSGTLWENLALGANVGADQVRKQLVDVGLTGPRFDDLTAPLLADGRGLSGGEVVRLVLARALLAGAPLLVVDDVAGVLDEPSRRRVADVLASRPGLAVIEATVDSPLLDEATVLALA